MRTASSDADRFLDPELLRRLDPLSIRSRSLVEGSMTGSHKSPFKGLSTEFADHRPYVRGDDLKRLDWKVYARNERHYIKQYEENTNLKAYILVDASRSMAFGSGAMTKFEYACRLAAGLAYVVIKQSDSAGLVVYGEKIAHYLPPRGALTHLRAMLDTLANTQADGGTQSGVALHGMAEMIKRRGLIIVISDLLDDPQTVIRGLSHFRQKRHDVAVLHVLDPAELDLPFTDVSTVVDMETQEKIRVSPRDLKDDYRRQVEAFIETYRSACFETGVDYATVSTASPPASLLSAWLSRRERLR